LAFLSRCAGALAALVLSASMVAHAAAQDNLRLVEQDIKAGLLYNFLRYTEWPAPHAQPNAVVCIYGRDPFEGRLAPMTGRTVNQQRIEVRAVRTYAEMDACSMLVVSADERARWPQLRAYLARRDVLTVSDYDGFARAGGMIEFTRLNNRVGVRVNVEAVQEANLAVQDRLMRLATAVRTGPP
jgi:hypothetical protein